MASGGKDGRSASYESFGIRDVWAGNMEREFRQVRKVLLTHKYIAMDTEFPGVVTSPTGEFRDYAEYSYHNMRVNVNMLKIIQLGLTFFDENGNKAKPISTWQFNFEFNEKEDIGAPVSIELLRNSGINFKRHATEGIQPNDFAEELLTSGALMMDEVTWVTFHSGYDFGYLVRLLMGRDIEPQQKGFFDDLGILFVNVYDLKYMMKSVKDMRGGLQDLANVLKVERHGPQHQAGSDSLLTGEVFFRMREEYFENNVDSDKYNGKLYNYSTTLFKEQKQANAAEAAKLPDMNALSLYAPGAAQQGAYGGQPSASAMPYDRSHK